MADGYDREDIIRTVKKHFEDNGFTCETYWEEELGGVRLPLYCFKMRGDVIEEDICVDIITEETVSKATYFPRIPFQKAFIENACSVKFFQYYLPRAKIFWAYWHYVRKNKDYYEFKAACEANGIGLLEVSDQVHIIKDAVPLHEIFIKQVEEEIKEVTEELKSPGELTQVEKRGGETFDEFQDRGELTGRLSSLIGKLEDEYLHYLVYYGSPRFRRRAIVSRQDTPDLSLTLINKLQGISNLQYGAVLVNLATKYRDECRDDTEIALQTIQSLWKSQLKKDYPPIQKYFELVLLLDPYYRDHFLHQFQVFLLGALIIDKLYNSGPVRSFEKLCGCKLEFAWLAASTYHDFNYAIQELETWMTSFFRQTLHVRHYQKDPFIFLLDVEKTMVRNEFLHKIEGLFEAIGCGEVDDPILRFILGRLTLNKNHAALGALTFLNIFKGKGTLTTLAANHAAASILLHDDLNWQYFCGKTATANCQKWERAFSKKKLLPQLKFQNMPLAFLLAFCDNVQEWGREGRGYETEKVKLEEIELEDDKFLVHISLTDDSACSKKWINLQELGQYLDDIRFGIRLWAREGSFDKTLWMAGKPK